MLRLKYIIVAVSLVLSACKSSYQLSDLNWFLGKWQVNESRSYEEWKKIDDNLFKGVGYKIRKNDTLVTETIELVQRGKDLFYIPVVTNQNEGKPVEFKLVSQKKKEIIFENKSHDFPQRIIYVKTGEDLINARIEGVKQGVFSHVDFKLNRVN